jgi:hypothetical protein
MRHAKTCYGKLEEKERVDSASIQLYIGNEVDSFDQVWMKSKIIGRNHKNNNRSTIPIA